MEKLVFIPGLLMSFCIITCLVLLFKTKNQSQGAPALFKFFGLELLTGMYLTDKGKSYRIWYWRVFFLVFVFAAVTMLFMYLFVPEFSNELVSAARS
ncbi:hypothetical protein [Teredinibacter sp. KSP-S5-2]|uniref:hypothetical protein n=1 Tax=Teredinibacter sp. KSP-S5-2 TaxID=3034506 RepID=UPI002934553F|nr:hypothetical protein [Teredinibacter sp. KSP-S5-2]WNO09978.1 hypothetical protein P5V12_02215 [Teredinibacter sp. KSP-S5-2]